MQCERCGDGAVTLRKDAHLCERCAVRADWEEVALSAQGFAVEPATAPAARPVSTPDAAELPPDPAPAEAPVASIPAVTVPQATEAGANLPPADPFTA